MTLEAKEHCCQEASPLSGATYIPCNRPARYIVGWTKRVEGPYRMCEMCADHNVKNRGAEIVGPYTLGSEEPKQPVLSHDTDESRIRRFIEIDDFLKAENKRFTEFCKPYREEMQAIQAGFLSEFTQTKRESVRTDAGTAYSSTTMTPSITDNDAYLDYVLEHWEDGGSEMLQVRAPQVTAFRNYMDKHEGQLPPGTSVAFNTSVNIRRS